LSQQHIRLDDLGLFGNDAAEDEDQEIFLSYVIDVPQLATFEDPDRPLCITRGYKGEGKTALLRVASLRLAQKLPEGAVLLSSTASDLAPDFTSDEFAKCVRAWKAAVFGAIAAAIGTRLGKAWTDDAMLLVEIAEKNGFKSRNAVTAISQRLLQGVELGPIKLAPKPAVAGKKAIAGAVRRIAQNGPPIWLFVDDIDKNFENTRAQKTRVAAFFDAARELAREVPELRIRAAVRPNVWTTLKAEFESLSHVEQYISDLTWSEDGCRELLAKRVEAYLHRTAAWQDTPISRRAPGAERERELISLVFESPMDWGRTTRPPHVVIFTLSKHRPRWMIELCKVAGSQAQRAGHPRILHDDLFAELTSFGDRRIQDTIAEFRSQCSGIEDLVQAFSREPEQLTTDQLFGVIDRKVLPHIDLRISGIPGRPRALQVAAFLYEIGFFYGRRDHADGTYEHVTYSDKPALLRARSNIDDGMSWEVHPVFRQALEMRDASGKELRRDTGARRRRRPS
jgi:hypothetical protein